MEQKKDNIDGEVEFANPILSFALSMNEYFAEKWQGEGPFLVQKFIPAATASGAAFVFVTAGPATQ